MALATLERCTAREALPQDVTEQHTSMYMTEDSTVPSGCMLQNAPCLSINPRVWPLQQWDVPVQAFACFSNALALEPRHADTLMAAGALYKSCGLLPEALQSLEAALEAKPKDPAVKQALAVVLTDLGVF